MYIIIIHVWYHDIDSKFYIVKNIAYHESALLHNSLKNATSHQCLEHEQKMFFFYFTFILNKCHFIHYVSPYISTYIVNRKQ